MQDNPQAHTSAHHIFQLMLSLTEMLSWTGPITPRGALSIICQARRRTVMGDKDDRTTQNKKDVHEN